MNKCELGEQMREANACALYINEEREHEHVWFDVFILIPWLAFAFGLTYLGYNWLNAHAHARYVLCICCVVYKKRSIQHLHTHKMVLQQHIMFRTATFICQIDNVNRRDDYYLLGFIIGQFEFNQKQTWCNSFFSFIDRMIAMCSVVVLQPSSQSLPLLLCSHLN